MTVEKRIEEAVGAIMRRVSRLEIERIVSESVHAAYEAGASDERCAIAYRLGEMTAISDDDKEREVYMEVAAMIHARSEGKEE